MPAGRFWAKNNPAADFKESVQKTADLFYGWQFKKFIQISSVSARCQLDTVYGRHKAAAENVCNDGKSLIVRLGPMFAETLSKGVLIDMLQKKPVFIAGESRYCFTSLGFVASWIATHTDRRGIVEVGARNALELREVARHLNAPVEFSGPIDHQEIPEPESDFPPAEDVYEFLNWYRTTHSSS
jgi:hypothetical protein